VAISGWGLASEGEGKISKSRGGGPISPGEVFAQYPVDAVRYWAASTGLGKDAVISMEKIQAGDKLLTKLWNVARFCERFIGDYRPPEEIPALSPGDSWILSRLQTVIERATGCLANYDYATAKSEAEMFFWRDLADNYLEMAKKRLYGEDGAGREGALFALFVSLRDVVKLFAPFLPYVTEVIYREIFARIEDGDSVHLASWPKVDGRLLDDDMESIGGVLIGVATAVRRYKSEAGIPLGRELARIQVILKGELMNGRLQEAGADIASITRAKSVEFLRTPDFGLELLETECGVGVAVEREAV
jgi:valyl-tRNA synthetase